MALFLNFILKQYYVHACVVYCSVTEESLTSRKNRNFPTFSRNVVENLKLESVRSLTQISERFCAWHAVFSSKCHDVRNKNIGIIHFINSC